MSNKAYDFIMQELNDNQYGIEFIGDVYLLQHPNSEKGFALYKEGNLNKTLELERHEYVPVALNLNEPTKYLGKNKRIQWQQQLHIPIRSENHMKFDAKNNKPLKAIEETIERLHADFHEYEDRLIGLKIDDVKHGQTIPINGEQYVVIIVSLYIDEIRSGYFGKQLDFKLKLPDDTEWTELDIIEVDVGFGADYNTTRDVADMSNNKVVVKNGGIVWSIDFYLHDSPLEKIITKDIIEGKFDREYIGKIVFEPFDIEVEKRLAIIQAGKGNKKLSVMAINIEFHEVAGDG